MLLRSILRSRRLWPRRLDNTFLLQPALDKPADWKTLHTWMTELGLKPSAGLAARGNLPLTRAELTQHLWLAIRDRIADPAPPKHYLEAGNDADGDGRTDREDPLPLDRDNDNLPDALDG